MSKFWEQTTWPRTDWRGNPMTMVKWLIVLNVIVFIPQMFFRTGRYAFTDIALFGLSWDGLKSLHLWQPLSFVLEYNDIWQLVFFLVSLWFLGRDLEYHIGPGALLKLYILSAIAGAACYLTLSHVLNDGRPLFGSEAPFLAILVAYATLWPDRSIMFDVTAKWWAIIFIAATAWYLGVVRSPVFLGHMGGVAAGYIFVKAAGYSTPPAWFENVMTNIHRLRLRRHDPTSANRYSPPGALQSEEPDTEDFIGKEVDPILDKILNQGINSLTASERRILENARRRIQKKSK